VAEIHDTLKRIGLTPAKTVLIGVLGIVLVGVLYMQFGSSGTGVPAAPPPPVITAPPSAQRPAAQAAPTAAAVELQSPLETQALDLDQSRWESPELSTVIAYDPFALPPSFPQPPQIAVAAALADSEATTSAAADARQLAETLERLRRQLEELKQRGVHVIVNKNDHFVAMIGDRLVHVGDEINGFIITEIDPNGVRVERKEVE
jgi:hypothetical protein